MTGKLYLIPNIIHPNTESEMIAPAIISVVGQVDYYLVENVRTARRYLSTLMKLLPIQERTAIDQMKFEILDKNTSSEEVSKMLQPVRSGISCGVISESGCPGIADPGSEAVRTAHRMKIEVVPLPGPSSIFMSLMASGMNGQAFTFHGYLPIDKQQLILKIKQLENASRKNHQTQIFIETPYRNQRIFDTLLSTCGNDTALCIAKDITSPDALIRNLTIAEWKREKISLDKTPAVFQLSSY